ncbi:MAG: alpha/beta fold hydrolase [Planctomycetes bacterium]|nr:alpha/beta fold hydrolase [Planctomycetota bacterium]
MATGYNASMKITIEAGIALEYRDEGKGPTVVLLHGFPLCSAMWRPQIAALQKDYRVIVPDLRGFGGSTPVADAPSLEQMADDVGGLLDALRIAEPVVLGGLSMGGYAALAVARRYPGRLRGLILADTRAEPDDAQGKANRDAMIDFARANDARAVIDKMLPRLLAEKTLAARPEVVQEIRDMAAAQEIDGIVGALKVLRDRPDARPGLASIRVPTLVVVGSEDALTPPAMAETLAAGIADATLVIIPGAGHMSNLEEPEAFNAAIAGFLRRLG